MAELPTATLTTENAELGKNIVPVPLASVHLPVPLMGVLPLSENSMLVTLHLVMSPPAFATVTAVLEMVTLEVEGGQAPLVIVH